MNNLFVSYEIAKQLVDNGFNEDCLAYYYVGMNPEKEKPCLLNVLTKDFNRNGITFSCPLHQQAIDWFREEHGIYIEVLLANVFDINKGWKLNITETIYETGKYCESMGMFLDNDFYIAREKAIEEALKLLP